MRNIFLLLSCLLCLQACNDEKEVDWTPDALTVLQRNFGRGRRRTLESDSPY